MNKFISNTYASLRKNNVLLIGNKAFYAPTKKEKRITISRNPLISW